MHRSLRITVWGFATLAFVVTSMLYVYFRSLPSGAEPILSASVALLGVTLGSALTVELQLYSGNIDRIHRSDMQRLEREHQLRLAALEKRLIAHQEAFSTLSALEYSYYPHFLEVYLLPDERHLYTSGYNVRLMENLCRRWHDQNCFYLDENAEREYVLAIQDRSKLGAARESLRSTVQLPTITVRQMVSHTDQSQ